MPFTADGLKSAPVFGVRGSGGDRTDYGRLDNLGTANPGYGFRAGRRLKLEMGVPVGSLQSTVEVFNRHAGSRQTHSCTEDRSDFDVKGDSLCAATEFART